MRLVDLIDWYLNFLFRCLVAPIPFYAIVAGILLSELKDLFQESGANEWVRRSNGRLAGRIALGAVTEPVNLSTSVIDYILSPFKQLLALINWSMSSDLARLELLTRVSFLSIFVVPIIAAFWPAIRETLNGVFLAASLLGIDGSGTTIQSTWDAMPKVWVFTFYASIFTVVGQFFFQAFAPATIKRQSKDEFVAARKREYIDSPTPIEREQALSEIKLASSWIKQQPRLLKRQLHRQLKVFDAPLADNEIDMITLGAEARYLLDRFENRFAATMCTLAYVHAIICVVAIVALQSDIVMKAALVR